MSGVYIKGMEMPTSCAKCRLFGEYGCPFVGPVGYALTEGRRNEDCPLIPVPDHGDLIDRDVFLQPRFISDKNEFDAGVLWAIAKLEKQPAIIRADEGER